MAILSSNARWGACTQAGQTVHCVAIATVTNQGGSRVVRVQYLAFYLPDGTGCDADIPAIDPGASRSLSCVVTMDSNFPPGTTGHPPNKDVILRLMRPDGSEARDVVSFFGGQGTINVNSWAPDSNRFAYVAYPVS